jgi:hypothetical protein
MSGKRLPNFALRVASFAPTPGRKTSRRNGDRLQAPIPEKRRRD